MMVSVLIPVRGDPGPLLAASLASLVEQDHGQHEVLLLRAGGDAVNPAGRNVREIPVPPGAITGEILNRGRLAAGGEVFAHLEPGERLHPGALTLAAGHLALRPEVRVLYGETYGLAPDGTVGGPRPGVPFDFEHLQSECFLMRPAVFWRGEVFGRAGVFDETLDGDAADYDFWLRAGGEFPFAHLAGCLLGGGWPLRGRGCGAAAMLRVSRRHGHSTAALRSWLRRVARERATGESSEDGDSLLHSPSPRVRCGYVGRLLLAAAELGLDPDEALLEELHLGLGEVER